MNDVLVGIAWVGGFVVLVVGALGVHGWHLSDTRKLLLQKYGDDETVDLIMRRQIWIGQTKEQLLSSRGPPEAVDHKVQKTKTTDVWKYDQVGRSRYNTRVTVENGEVIGFEQKG